MERRRISSQLGSVGINAQNQRELVIDDQSDYESQIPNHLRNNPNIRINEQEAHELRNLSREAASAKKNERPPQRAVSRLEVLVGIGRLTTEVEIDNAKFCLRSLKNKEIRDVINKSLTEENSFNQTMTLRNYTLAYSLFEIEGDSISNYIGSDDFDSRVELIEEFSSNTVDALWKAYNDMQDSYKKTINEDLGSDAKQVSDTIKKS